MALKEAAADPEKETVALWCRRCEPALTDTPADIGTVVTDYMSPFCISRHMFSNPASC